MFSSDRNRSHLKLIDFAKGANVPIIHLAIPAGATNSLRAAPEVVGRAEQTLASGN